MQVSNVIKAWCVIWARLRPTCAKQMAKQLGQGNPTGCSTGYCKTPAICSLLRRLQIEHSTDLKTHPDPEHLDHTKPEPNPLMAGDKTKDLGRKVSHLSLMRIHISRHAWLASWCYLARPHTRSGEEPTGMLDRPKVSQLVSKS